MPTPTNPSQPNPQPTKWWGHSMTIWGVILTSLTTVLPLLARAIGIDLPTQDVADLGTQLMTLFQAIGSIAGIVVTICGRARANRPLDLTIPPFGPRDWRRNG